MFRTLSAPIMVQWEVTPSCNHNCIHCYNHWRTKEHTNLNNGYATVINELVTQEIISSNVFAINITGGEPLLVLEKIAPFIKKLSKNNIQITMNSNLTLLTQKKARLIKECGVRSILVSIPSGNVKTCDQITGRHNSLEQITNGISLAKDFDIRIFTNMVVSRVNKNQIEETANLVASLGLNHFAATKASDPSENNGFTSNVLSVEEFCEMQEKLEKAGSKFGLKINSLEANPACAYGDTKPKQGYKFCNAGKTTCTIGFDGIVRPCNRVNMQYGHISSGLQKCWLKMEDWRTNKWIPKVCTRCRLKSICGGGCKADAIKTFGDIAMQDPLCTATPIPLDTRHLVKSQPNYTEQEFKVNPSLKQRTEEFGSILFLSLGNWVAVNHELSFLFQRKNKLTKNEMMMALSTDKDGINSTIDILIQKEILIKQKIERG